MSNPLVQLIGLFGNILCLGSLIYMPWFAHKTYRQADRFEQALEEIAYQPVISKEEYLKHYANDRAIGSLIDENRRMQFIAKKALDD